MSSIYIQEPPTNGKVLLKTTVGEIEIELWSKESPKSVRNFLQFVLNKKYDKTLFHRLVPSFITQCGENVKLPDSAPIHRIESHSRLRFSRRGLVALAQCDDNERTMEFFFTLDATPELQNKHSIIGKVTGETIYNLIKLNDSQTDNNDRPLFPHKINKVKVLHNPFDDLFPQIDESESIREKERQESKKPKREGVKNFQLISFGDEAEQDEQEVVKFPKDSEKVAKPKPRSPSPSTSSSKDKEAKSSKKPSKPEKKDKKVEVPTAEDSDSDYELTLEKEKLSDMERKKKEIQDQIRDIKKQYHKDKKEKNQVREAEKQEIVAKNEDDTIQDYLDEKQKYKSKKQTTKGATRESFTLDLLAKFKNRLHSALESTETAEEKKPEKPNAEDSDDENWLAHKLDFSDSQQAVLAKDASKKEDDWYDIYDPRNALNKRKRGAEKGESSKKTKS